MPEKDNFYSVQFAGPGVANDFLVYIFREQFLVASEQAKENGGLINGFVRVNLMKVEAPADQWKRLFKYFQDVTPEAVNHRAGMLVFAIYMNMRNFKSMAGFDFSLDPFENDIVLEKRRLFEACMDDIFEVHEN